jgi:hypothetical protein
MLLRTQRMMKPAAYLTEHRLSVVFSEGTSGAPTPVSSAAGASR